MSKKGKIIMKPSEASIGSRYAIIYTQWNKDIIHIEYDFIHIKIRTLRVEAVLLW